MPKFLVNQAFQHAGRVNRAGLLLIVSADELVAEVAKGKHDKTGKWMSGLLNNCAPADDATADLLAEATGEKKVVVPEEESEDSQSEAIEDIRAKFTDIGAAYDNRWGLKKLQMELLKAQKMRG